MSGLLDPFHFASLDLRNRFVMAPMTRNYAFDGVPRPEVADYYAKRAAAGVGLIVTEGTWIPHRVAGNRSVVPGIESPASIDAWRGVTDAVHSAGSPILMQAWHLGMARNPQDHEGFTDLPSFGPSGLAFRDGQYVQARPEPSTEEIEEVIAAYGLAAANAERAGFDGVELHAGHGYLIDQFLWSETNRRNDSYGGSNANRARFACDIVREIRRVTKPGFVVVFRFSQWKIWNYDAKFAQTPDELEGYLAPIAAAGVDAFHVSTRRYWDAAFSDSDLTLAGWTKKIAGLPVIAVGSFALDREFLSAAGAGTPAALQVADVRKAEELLDRGEFDLMAVGRMLLANPGLVEKYAASKTDDLVPYEARHREVFA